MPRLFITYSHDSEPHRDRVLTLAHRLLAAGHNVILDRFTVHPDPNWPQWMARELIAADVVLCICTPTYRARFEGRGGGSSARSGRRVNSIVVDQRHCPWPHRWVARQGVQRHSWGSEDRPRGTPGPDTRAAMERKDDE